MAAFVEARKLDAALQLDPDLKTKELEQAWEAAKKGGGGAPAGGGGTPAGDFTHTPVAEQQVRTPIPIYVEYGGEEALTKVTARYKGFGMTEWKALELKKMGEKGWGALIPCQDVQQGTTQYYIQGLDKNNDMVASSGDRNNPFKVTVKREKIEGEAPHLPGQAPPSQCADTGDCPPDFPGCKKGPGVSTPAEEGKDDGKECEEDSDCKSGSCKAPKDSEQKVCQPKEGGKFSRIWVGVWGAFDMVLVPGGDDVCKLNKDALPLNDPPGYYCTRDNGDDYPTRVNKNENDAIVLGKSDKVSGGLAAANVRAGLSFDYAINPNLMVGARLGFLFVNTYTGKAASDEGKTLPAPIHIEARVTYLIGTDALAKPGVAPFVFGGGGVTEWDAKIPVTVVETGNPAGRNVDAWKISGPAFIGLGGGIRYAFSPKAALLGGLHVNFAIGSGFVPVLGPEFGVQLGF
jgi:hypothetical protein